MREINVNQIEEMLKKACGEIAVNYSPDLKAALLQAEQNETSTLAENAMQMLLQNAEIACRENIPICQDTGMAIVYVKAGQEVHFTGGSLKEAIQKGVAEGYRENYLRASIVDDPLYDRKNTGNNTTADMQYSNYKVKVTVGLLKTGSTTEAVLNNSDKIDHVIYTNAKVIAGVIDTSGSGN